MMIRALKLILIAALIPFALSSCKKKEEAQPQPAVKKAAEAQGAVKKAEAAQEPISNTAGISQSAAPAVLRNPFQNYIMVMRGSETVKKMKGPLECCELAQFRIIALVVGGEKSYALVRSPDGKKYIVRAGDLIGSREGRVVKIADDGLTVREVMRDDSGKVTSTVDAVLGMAREKDREGSRQ